jgi:hypothetical protein
LNLPLEIRRSDLRQNLARSKAALERERAVGRIARTWASLQSDFHLDETTIATDCTLVTRPISTRSMAEALGVPGEAVEQQLALIDGETTKAKEKISAAEGKN